VPWQPLSPRWASRGRLKLSPVAGGAGALEGVGLRWKRETAIALLAARMPGICFPARITLTVRASRPRRAGASARVQQQSDARLFSRALPVVSARRVTSAQLARAVRPRFAWPRARWIDQQRGAEQRRIEVKRLERGWVPRDLAGENSPLANPCLRRAL
jgi:hypothetical protein